MSEELRTFFAKYQNFLRNCERFGLAFAHSIYTQDESETLKNNKNNFEDTKIIKCDDEEMIEAAENYAFEIIVDENSDDEMTNKALSLLSDVVNNLRRNTNSFDQEEIIIAIIDLLYHKNKEISLNTLRLVFLLSQGSRKPMNSLIKNNLLQSLLEIFNLKQDTEEFETVFHIIVLISSNIAALSSKKVHYLLQNGYLNLIFKAINEGNINTKLAAAFLSSNIMTKGLKYDIQKTINMFILNYLFEFLSEDYDPRLHHCILDGIFNCLQNQISIETIPLQNILKNEEYLSILYALLTNEDEITAQLSQSIISQVEKV